ncbi:hypothetical protein D3C71_78920 [compost metagenome]
MDYHPDDPFQDRMVERLEGMQETNVKPKTIILPTEDLIDQLHRRLGGEKLPKKDLDEILTQVVCVLLNAEGPVQDAHLQALPDFNRIVSTEMFAALKPAVGELAVAVRDRLMEFGADCDGGFPYFFDSLLDRDVVLTHLPY